MSHDTDAAFSAFLAQCVKAGSPQCALAQNNVTASRLENDIYNLFETIKQAPVPLSVSQIEYDAMSSMVDYSSLKNLILLTLYHPFHFQLMAAGLQGLLNGNLSAVAAWRDAELSIFAETTEAESITGIRCSDKHTRASTIEEILPTVNQVAGGSKIGGFTFTMPCARWRMDAKERYTGNFQVQTKFPVLLVGDTYDPATPIASAYNVSSGFVRSVVLERKGFGVSSCSRTTLWLR